MAPINSFAVVILAEETERGTNRKAENQKALGWISCDTITFGEH
jgi:hypothetical protein